MFLIFKFLGWFQHHSQNRPENEILEKFSKPVKRHEQKKTTSSKNKRRSATKGSTTKKE
jgi:hypothetical protein